MFKILIFLLSWIVSWANPNSSNICKDNPTVVHEKFYNGYHIMISSAGNQACHLLDIEKQGRRLLHDQEIGGHFYFGSNWQNRVKPFSHVTGKEEDSLLISKWTGGAHCCFSLEIFNVSRQFKKIATINGGNFYPVLKDINKDGIPEVELIDDFLAGVFSSFAQSAKGNVILKYSRGTYSVAMEYMRKNAPSLNSMNHQIKLWQKELRSHKSPEWPPPSLVQAVTDLFFSGNEETALELVDRSWPSDVSGKENFLKIYRDALRGSLFYPEFESQLSMVER